MSKFNYSKMLMMITTCVFVLVTTSGIFLSIFGKDTSMYMYAIPTSGGVWGLALTSYFKKSSLENNIKIQLGMIKEILQLKHEYQEDSSGYLDEIESKAMDKMNETIDNGINDTLTPPEIPSL